MTAHASLFPPDWNHDSSLHWDLLAALERSDCGWEQTCCALGFAVSSVVASYPDEARRVAMAQVIAGNLLEVAQTGVMPGATVQ